MKHSFDGGADYYIGANPDGRFHPAAITRLVRRLRPRDLFGLRQFPTEHPAPYDPATGRADWISGAAFCISREAFEAVGGFDECFFMYCEDVDLSWRFRAAGRQCVLVPDALYHHDIANRSFSIQSQSMSLSAGWLLGKKWGSDSFVRHCQEKLEQANIPPPDTEVEPFHGDTSVAHFAGEFVFSEKGRW